MKSFVALAGLGLAAAAPAADKITSLPGFGAPLTDAYSGACGGRTACGDFARAGRGQRLRAAAPNPHYVRPL